MLRQQLFSNYGWGVIASVLLISSCAKEDITSITQQPQAATQITASNTELNDKMETLAKQLAISMKSESFREMIKSQIAKKFDGDYDVLLKDLKLAQSTENLSFDTYLYSAEKNGEGNISSIDFLIKKTKNIQLSIPVNFENWNAKDDSQIPLVTFIPNGVNIENDIDIIAYDSNGNEITLNSKKAPEFPVIVIGNCERIDANGKIMQFEDFSSIASVNNSEMKTEGSSSAKTLRLKRLKIDDLQESWLLGAAEVYFAVKDESNVSSPYSGYLYLGSQFSVSQSMQGEWSSDKLWDLFTYNVSDRTGSSDKVNGDIVFYIVEMDGGGGNYNQYTSNGSTYTFFGRETTTISLNNADDVLGYLGVQETSFGSQFSGTTYSSPNILTAAGNGYVRFSVYEK